MKLKDIAKIEFWVATALYGIAVLMLISNSGEGVSSTYLSSFFLPELFRYSIIYFSFLLLNFCVLPALFQQKDKSLPIVLLTALLLTTGIITGIFNTYKEAYMFQQFDSLTDAYNYFFLKGFKYSIWLVLIISIYVCLKKLIVYFNDADKRIQDANNQMKLDAVFGAGVWFVGLLLLLATGAPFEMILCWTLVTFAATATVVYSIYHLIPLVKSNGKSFKSYFWKLFLLTIISCIPLGLIAMLFGHRILPAVVVLVHTGTQLIVSAALSWHIYKKRTAATTELTKLRTELGQSDASLSFLRSQINPHFLFNALNTLYGTALQEKAERTGEGIQKLGDMMRFMLQENHQDKISLVRDIDYLNNYIALQKLRISRTSDITIETQIEDHLDNLQIAPMLLIPFVENAFKHGISLQEPSHIKISLQTQAQTLYFDVYNSIHLKKDNDPEKLQSGIGLQNVKRRLELIYPKQHELIIRENAKEFFIHLTLQF